MTVQPTIREAGAKVPDTPEETPHICNNGWVTLGSIVIDSETGEETEEYALYPCRRCKERSEQG